MTKIEEIIQRLNEAIRDPKVELDYINPYTFLVAVVLSAQSTDKGVNKVTKDLFKKIKTPQDMVAFGQQNLEHAIRTIGLYRNKAKHIYALSKMLCDNFDGIVPDNQKELMKLPGVGQKSANVILNVLFQKPVIAVDTHVFRVAHRLELSNKNTPHKVEEDLDKIVPNNLKNKVNHLFVLHGRYVCKAKKPLCGSCCLNDICPYFLKVLHGRPDH